MLFDRNGKIINYKHYLNLQFDFIYEFYFLLFSTYSELIFGFDPKSLKIFAIVFCLFLHLEE